MRAVLLHGFAGTPAVWDDVIAAWPGPDAPIALPLPGHGSGAAHRFHGHCFRSWDDALDELAAQVGGAPVVGYSLGARLALGLLARDAIPAAVLISCNPGIDDAARPARRAQDARWAALLRTGGTAAFLDAWQAQPLFASQAAADPARLARRRAARETLDAEALAGGLETLGLAEMPDLRDALAARATGAQLVVGSDDGKFVGFAADAATRSPALVVEMLAGVGHDPTLEAPEALAAVLARGLARWARID